MNSHVLQFSAKWDMGYEDTCKWLDKKWRQPAPYGKWMVCLASGIGSAAFAAMLGGNSHDFIAAFITGGAAMGALKQIAGLPPQRFLGKCRGRCCYCNRCAYLLRHERAVYNGKKLL